MLKIKYKLNEDEDIVIFKIEYKAPDIKIPIVEYSLFGRDGSMKLNLNICSKLKILYYIPTQINDYIDYKYNPNNYYYFDKCHPIVSEDNTDLTVFDRRYEFNLNNMSLCESNCKFIAYVHGEIICECQIKVKFNSFLNNLDPYNLIFRFEDMGVSHFNIWLLDCLSLLSHKENLKVNLGSYIILGIIFIIIIGAIVFYCKGYENLLNQINNLAFLSSIHNDSNELEDSKNNIFNANENNSNEMAISKFQTKRNIINNKRITQNPLTNKIDNSFKSSKSKDAIVNEETKKDNTNEINEVVADNNVIENIKLEKNEIYTQRTDREMNNLSYESALKIDKRSFCQIYISLIKTKQLLIFTIFTRKDFNSRIIKVCYSFLLLSLFFVVNLFFVEDSTFHDLHISKGKFNIMFNLPGIIYSALICFFVSKFLESLIFTEMTIVEVRKGEGKEKKKIMRNVQVKVIIKCILFFTVSFLVLIFFWMYISCFCAVYKNTQVFIIKITFISFGIFNILPFFLNFIPPIFRVIALMNEEETIKNLCLYKLSQILQLIL